ncbi:hypothetical protein GTQ38_16380 [Flavobacteriaceae bacterium R33]|uniref:3-keto-disaccharide hydrolase domain-containing protein n=2 Tax=Poritiphilus flavus TaxID=2697053 RepID=A0A6L9EFX5_9FLAO|nr:hypothetical protein [Poritiphilus flavus]
MNAQSKRKKTKEISFPMNDKHWEYEPGTVEFFENRGIQAVRGKDGGYFVLKLKDFIFENGTIEFDVELAGTGFPGINFRMTEDLLEGENFYIRSFGPVSPLSRTTLQYASIIDSTTTWDLTDEYQAGAKITQEGWNHVKLVVHGKQMKVYVNDMDKPALHVPVLESKSDKGLVLLTGNVIYANFRIRPGAMEDLPAEPGYDPTTTDTRYIRNWMFSEPIDFEYGRDLVLQVPTMYDEIKKSDLPDDKTSWKPIKVEHRGLVNLSREYGLKREGGRRLVWLKTNISSDKQQIRNLKLGFNDEVWVFLNGKLLYMDKNYFGTPGQKYPKGRCSLENTSFDLPLAEGDNELLIGVGHFFYGWGIMARLDETNGLTLD